MEDKLYDQGDKYHSKEDNFAQILQAARDYRGDITLELDQEKIVGYLFNISDEYLELFIAGQPKKRAVALNEVKTIEFTGENKVEARRRKLQWLEMREKKLQQEQESENS